MKNIKYCLAAALPMFALSMAAQETYQDTKLIGNELNGTARYVGMGGAMEALGADISTIGSKPAGIGLFRCSGWCNNITKVWQFKCKHKRR